MSAKSSPNRSAPVRLPASARFRARAADPALFVGLDAHTDAIAVSLARADGVELRRYGLIGGGPDDVLRLAKKLQAAHSQLPLRYCYEAGPHG